MDVFGLNRVIAENEPKMKILFSLGHPAHFHLFKNVIANLSTNKEHTIATVIKSKDVLESLLQSEGINYTNLLPEGRKNDKFSIFKGVLKCIVRLYKFSKYFKPHILVGTSVEISYVGRFLGIPSINVNEDDFNAVPYYSYLAYPFANYIVAPKSCPTGRWEDKTIHYEGYHELAYLHPNNFKPDRSILKKYINSIRPYSLIRLSSLNAHHDFGISGLSKEVLQGIINKLERTSDVYITSEQVLYPEFKKYQLPVPPQHIHHIISFAKIFIGDSQTMAAEAAVLGVPSIRINDFVGKLGYLDELEKKYQLTFGVKPSEKQNLFTVIDELISNNRLSEEWEFKRDKMLSDKIDVTNFLTWLISSYPQSIYN